MVKKGVRRNIRFYRTRFLDSAGKVVDSHACWKKIRDVPFPVRSWEPDPDLNVLHGAFVEGFKPEVDGIVFRDRREDPLFGKEDTARHHRLQDGEGVRERAHFVAWIIDGPARRPKHGLNPDRWDLLAIEHNHDAPRISAIRTATTRSTGGAVYFDYEAIINPHALAELAKKPMVKQLRVCVPNSNVGQLGTYAISGVSLQEKLPETGEVQIIIKAKKRKLLRLTPIVDALAAFLAADSENKGKVKRSASGREEDILDPVLLFEAADLQYAAGTKSIDTATMQAKIRKAAVSQISELEHAFSCHLDKLVR